MILDNLPDRLDIDLNNNRSEQLTANFHPYFASFSSEIPRFFLRRFTSEGDTVLDPFCGSGTTLLEAILSNRNAVGIDVNPLACLISKVRTTPIPKDELDYSSIILMKIRGEINRLYGQLTLTVDEPPEMQIEIPDFLNRDYWFKPHVLKELGIIKSRIDSIEHRNLKDLFKVAFSSIIVKVSNQQHETRYKRVDKRINQFDTYLHFEKKVQEMVSSMRIVNKLNEMGNCRVYNQDLRLARLARDLNESVDLIVTSPPYLNAWDYHLYQRFRFYWLGFNPQKLRDEEIGAHLTHCYIENSVQRYSSDMTLCLMHIYRMLKKSAYCCMVIGDALVRGKRVDTGELITNIATKLGFEHRKTYNREIFGPHFSQKRSINKKIEHIIILRKT